MTNKEKIAPNLNIYIAILRGINVGGQRMIKMNALRQMFEGLGFQNVKTYIQSGNIIFTGKKEKQNELEKKIFKAIKEKFGFDVPVIVKKHKELKDIKANNPFIKDKTKDVAHLHLTFLSDNTKKENYNKIKTIHYQPDEFYLFGKAIYLYCPNGYGKSKLANSFWETKLKVIATTRNWKTIQELLTIADKILIK